MWQQKIWAGFNVKPEGGVSEELLDSQVRVKPARTQAPERYLEKGYRFLEEVFNAKFGIRLFQEHKEILQLFKKINRFRSTNPEGFFSLAKDLNKLFAEAINTKELQNQIRIPNDTKWGSLKTLENFLVQNVPLNANVARDLMTPLVGIYELRHADTHLRGSSLDNAYSMSEVDKNLDFIFQGFWILMSFVNTLYKLIEVIKRNMTERTEHFL